MKKVISVLTLIGILLTFTGCVQRTEEDTKQSLNPINEESRIILNIINKAETDNNVMILDSNDFKKVQGYFKKYFPITSKVRIPGIGHKKDMLEWYLNSEVALVMDGETRRGYILQEDSVYDIGYVDFKEQQFQTFDSYIFGDAIYRVEYENITKWSFGTNIIVTEMKDISICEVIASGLIIYDNKNYYIYNIESEELRMIAEQASKQYAIFENIFLYVDFKGRVVKSNLITGERVVIDEEGYNPSYYGYYKNGNFITVYE